MQRATQNVLAPIASREISQQVTSESRTERRGTNQLGSSSGADISRKIVGSQEVFFEATYLLEALDFAACAEIMLRALKKKSSKDFTWKGTNRRGALRARRHLCGT